MVVDVRELPQRSQQNGGALRVVRRRVWYVRVDSAADDSEVVEAADGIPTVGSSHPSFAGLIVTEISSEHAGFGNFVWRVEATYEARARDVEEEERRTIPNPLDRSARLSIDFAPFERNVVKDRHGNALLNSAGDRFATPLTVQDQRIRIVVRKNVTTWPAFLFSYRNKVNDDHITIRGISFPPRTLKFLPGAIPDLQTENGVTYIPIEFVLEEREESWDEDLLDAGFNYLDDEGKRRPIEIDGERPAVEQPLDGEGGILANPTPETVTYIVAEALDEVDFSVLPLE